MTSFRRLLPRTWRGWILIAVLLVVAGSAIAGYCIPQARQFAAAKLKSLHLGELAAKGHDHAHDDADHDEADHDHEDADHDHATPAAAGHDNTAHSDGDADEHDHAHEAPAHAAKTYDHRHEESSAIKLSKQAAGNIGLNLAKVELRSFERTMNVPGIVIERPGWSTMEVTAPMTGVVTRIYPLQGEAVEPGQPLFEVRLTHEDLLQVQTEFLRTVEELDVIHREVARLEVVSRDGVIAGKTLLERKYEEQKKEADLRAQKQALLLHGLTVEQLDNIVSKRMLLQSLVVRAPAHEGAGTAPVRPMQVQDLRVAQGKHVASGESLCTLADHSDLYLEGQAFEQDMPAINRAAAATSAVSAVLGAKSGAEEETIHGLSILYLDNKVDRESRAFRFFVTLPNRLVRENRTPEGRRFVTWQFQPGQRTRIRIPVEQWKDRIVLPVEAVALDGAEAYVFESNGDHFDRRPVHVEYRDQESVVIANDGSLQLGKMVAVSAAHQIQLAMKNKAGGGVDPHAGHNH